MRWYNDAAYDGDEDAWNDMLSAYFAHVAAITPRLPADLARLASEPRFNLHDARIVSLIIDRAATTIDLHADLDGERALRLHLGQASIVEEDVMSIAYAVEATYGEGVAFPIRTTIRAQEVEIAEDGSFLLRLRLWPFHVFSMAFREVSLEELAAPPDEGRPGVFLLIDEA